MKVCRGAVLVSGSELLDGRLRDANGYVLASALASRGVDVQRVLLAPDDLDVLVEDVRFLLSTRPDLLVTSGGLGTTHDDLMSLAVATALDRSLVEDPAARAIVEQRTRQVAARRGTPFDDLLAETLKLARLPDGADLLPPAGLAPGFTVRSGPTRVYAFPGVPQELRQMLDSALDQLAAGGVFPNRICRQLRIYGAGEIQVASLLDQRRDDRLGVAITAGGGEVTVALRYDPADVAAGRRATEVERAVSAGVTVFSRDGRTVDTLVADALLGGGQSVAVAESCTGGSLAARLVDVPGSSAYVRGGVVAYHNEVKIEVLGVPAGMLAQYGAVSEPVAAAMAERARALARADFGLGVTGIAGPDGGSVEKPVGLVFVALAGESGTTVERHLFPGDRSMVRRWATTAALHLLRDRLGA